MVLARIRKGFANYSEAFFVSLVVPHLEAECWLETPEPADGSPGAGSGLAPHCGRSRCIIKERIMNAQREELLSFLIKRSVIL